MEIGYIKLHPTKNVTPIPSSPNSRNIVWFTCTSFSHEWEGEYRSLTKNSKCPFCSNKKVLTGFNDLKTVNPVVAAEWHPTCNGQLKSFQVTAGSNQIVWWMCNKGHQWEQSIKERNKLKSLTFCPFCSNKKVLTGFNDLKTVNPELAEQFHPTLNGNLTAEKIVFGSNEKVWWLCSKGHEWEARVNGRKSLLCPLCSNRTVLSENSLAATHPETAKQWHPTRNGDLTPSQVVAGSDKKVWWLGVCNHEWETRISANLQASCLVCANKVVLPGFNDLKTTHPNLITEWDYNKNDLLPETVSFGSAKMVNWVCQKNHEWVAPVYNRTRINNSSNCPTCFSPISKSENEIYEFLVHNGIQNIVRSNRTILNGLELDIFIPHKKVAIEFNGLYWHSESNGKTKNYHYNKWLECQKQGIQLIQIWEDMWLSDPQKIKKMLIHKLQISEDEKVFARKTFIETLTRTESENFLNVNHVQGSPGMSTSFGLKNKNTNELVAVLCVKKQENDDVLYVTRYATSKTVVGGFTKLLSYVEKNLRPKKIVTFSDHCVSDGKLYSNTGFVADKELPPDYMYVVDNKRVHKFNYRLKRFKDDTSLVYVEGLTEKQLAELNNIPRIWDAGKTRWVKDVT